MRANNVKSDLLGFCIPTYNRMAYLSKCIDSILREVATYDIPIYISDNASEDGTESYIMELSHTYENIIYKRNLSNLGQYTNILNVIRMARSDYIWILGDDDTIKTGSVTKVIESLVKGVDYLVVNSSIYDRNLLNLLRKQTINCRRDSEYLPNQCGDLFSTLSKRTFNGFMSSMIIKTSLIQSLIPKYCEEGFVLKGNSWLLTAMFYEAIWKKSGKFVCRPQVNARKNPRVTDKDPLSFMYLDRIKAVEYLESIGYSKKNLKKSYRRSLLAIVFHSVLTKYIKYPSCIFDDFIKSDKRIPFAAKLVVMFVDILPRFVIKIANGIIRVIVK